MAYVEKHPCPYNQVGKCMAIKDWRDGEPIDCEYTPEQLTLSLAFIKVCSRFPGSYEKVDGGRIHPSNLRTLEDIARGAEKLKV